MTEIINTVVLYLSDFKGLSPVNDTKTRAIVSALVGTLRIKFDHFKEEIENNDPLGLIQQWHQEGNINTMTAMKLRLLMLNTEMNYIIKE